MTLFLHNSFAVTIGMAGFDGMGCFLSPSMAHLSGLNEGTRHDIIHSHTTRSVFVNIKGRMNDAERGVAGVKLVVRLSTTRSLR